MAVRSVVIKTLLSLTTLLLLWDSCACADPEGNIYTAIAHMEPLVDIEKRLLDLAREYLNKERRRLGEFKQFAASVESAMELSKDEPLKYLGNPVNSYLIIKRFTSGWRELTSRLEIDDSKIDEMRTVLASNHQHLPTHDIDLLGATASIFRLQDTYGITAREISDGKIKGISRSAHQMTAEDCIQIASYAHNVRRYIRMEGWGKEAERIMDDPNLTHRVGNASRLALYELLSWTSYLSNDLPEALKYVKLVLDLDPKNIVAKRNEEIYSWFVERKLKSDEPETKWMEKAKELLDSLIALDYIQACRNTKPVPLKIKNPSKLVCYMKNDHSLLILKPVKTTVVHDNPYVAIFHDVVSDKEINTLKRLATPYLRQAKVVETDITEADYRIAKTMFLMDSFPGVKKMDKKLNGRFEAITGLNTESAEQLQMNNYGLGGQYEFHIDHGEEGSFVANHPNGNRLATLLLYLTNVERGGETVFTKIGISVAPKKGDAVFWYNLHRNGKGIDDTQHASCPVVSGSKWVANKWFHTHGNEFRRKCSLNKEE